MVEQSVNWVTLRRSTRLSLSIPVTLTSLDPHCPFVEKTDTVTVNAHGCGVRISRQVPLGTRVRIELLNGYRSTTAAVVQVNPMGPGTGYLIGLVLEEPSNFWGIPRPPDDWPNNLVYPAARELARSAAAGASASGGNVSKSFRGAGTKSETGAGSAVPASVEQVHAGGGAHVQPTGMEAFAALESLISAVQNDTPGLKPGSTDVSPVPDKEPPLVLNSRQHPAVTPRKAQTSADEQLVIATSIRQKLDDLAARLEDTQRELGDLQRHRSLDSSMKGVDHRFQELKGDLGNQLTEFRNTVTHDQQDIMSAQGRTVQQIESINGKLQEFAEANRTLGEDIATLNKAVIGNSDVAASAIQRIERQLAAHTDTSSSLLKHVESLTKSIEHLAKGNDDLEGKVAELETSFGQKVEVQVSAVQRSVESIAQEHKAAAATIVELQASVPKGLDALIASIVQRDLESRFSSFSNETGKIQQASYAAIEQLQQQLVEHTQACASNVADHLSRSGNTEDRQQLESVGGTVARLSREYQTLENTIGKLEASLSARIQESSRVAVQHYLQSTTEHQERPKLRLEIADHQQQIRTLQQANLELRQQIDDCKRELARMDRVVAAADNSRAKKQISPELPELIDKRVGVILDQAIQGKLQAVIGRIGAWDKEHKDLFQQVQEQKQQHEGFSEALKVQADTHQSKVDELTMRVKELASSVTQDASVLEQRMMTRISSATEQIDAEIHHIHGQDIEARAALESKLLDIISETRREAEGLMQAASGSREELNRTLKDHQQAIDRLGNELHTHSAACNRPVNEALERISEIDRAFKATVNTLPAEILAQTNLKIEQSTKQLDDQLRASEQQMLAQIGEQQRTCAALERKAKEHGSWQLEADATLRTLGQRADQLASEQHESAALRDSLRTVIDALPTTIQEHVAQQTAPAIAEAHNRLSREVEWAQEESERLSRKFDESIRRRQTDVCAALENRVEQLKRETHESLSHLASQLGEELQHRLRADVDRQQRELRDTQNTLRADQAEIRKQMHDAGLQLARSIRSGDTVDELVRGLPATIEAKLTEGAVAVTNEFRTRLNSEMTVFEQEAATLRSKVEEGLIRRERELLLDVERRTEQIAKQLEENITAAGDKTSAAIQLQLSAKANEHESELNQLHESYGTEAAQAQASLQQTLSAIQQEKFTIEKAVASLGLAFKTQIKEYADSALAQIHSQADHEVSQISIEFAHTRENAQRYLTVRESEYASHVKTAMQATVDELRKIFARVKHDAQDNLQTTVAESFKAHAKQIAELEAGFETRAAELESSGLAALNTLYGSFDVRLHQLADKLDAELSARLNEAVARATLEQQNSSRAVTDRILTEVVNRANTLANDLIHVTTAARNEAEKLQAEKTACTEALLNTAQILSQQLDGFKNNVQRNVVEATEQVTKKSELVVDLAKEPLDRKVRECTKDLNEMIGRSTTQFRDQVATIERTATEASHKRMTELMSSFESETDALLEQATARCQNAVREILASIARPLHKQTASLPQTSTGSSHTDTE
jgi:hypothetical protein